MADNIDDVNESAEELVEMFKDLERQGKLTRDDLEKLAKSTSNSAKAAREFGKAAGETMAGFKNFALSVGGGSTEIDTMKQVVSATGNAIAGLLEAIPFVGKALSAITKAAVEVANLAIDRLHVSFQAFQELSKQGLIGAQGISGLRDAMINSQIPMEKFAKILSESSKDLMYFSGTALKGSETMTGVMIHMQKGQDMQLRRLGMSVEEIGETVVDFSKMNQIMGMKQNLSTDQIAKKTVAYGKELDLIAKLTGMQRKDIQKNREQMMNDTRFSAWANQQKGKVDEKHIRATMDFVGSIKKLAPTMGQGIQDLFASGGIATTEAGRRLIQQGMGPTVNKIKGLMMSGQIDAAQAQKMMFTEAMRNKDKFRDLSAIVGDFGAGIPFEEMLKLATAAGASEEDIKKLKEAQGKQSDGTDELTDGLINTTKSLERAQTNIDAIATAGNYAAKVVEFMAKQMEKLTYHIKTTVMGMDEDAAKQEQKVERQVYAAKEKGITGVMVGEGEDARFKVLDTEFKTLQANASASLARIRVLQDKAELTEKEKKELEKEKQRYKKYATDLQWVRQEDESKGTTARATKYESTVGTGARNIKGIAASNENWADWRNDYGLIDKIFRDSGVIQQAGAMNQNQIKGVQAILERYKKDFGGDLGNVKGEDYEKMKAEIKAIGTGAESADMLSGYETKRREFLKWEQQAKQDGWTQEEVEERNKQLTELQNIGTYLKNMNIYYEQIDRNIKTQTELQKQRS